MNEYLATVEEIALNKMQMYERLVAHIVDFKHKYKLS